MVELVSLAETSQNAFMFVASTATPSPHVYIQSGNMLCMNAFLYIYIWPARILAEWRNTTCSLCFFPMGTICGLTA
jgi:hypothetical protein